MTVTWIKCNGDIWCPFETVNLASVNAFGVYIIWHGGPNPWTVRVGQGDIAARIIAHRSDSEVLVHKGLGLWVTWASVPAVQMHGVENYLADRLSPKVGERWPDAEPIAVNLPW